MLEDGEKGGCQCMFAEGVTFWEDYIVYYLPIYIYDMLTMNINVPIYQNDDVRAGTARSPSKGKAFGWEKRSSNL